MPYTHLVELCLSGMVDGISARQLSRLDCILSTFWESSWRSLLAYVRFDYSGGYGHVGKALCCARWGQVFGWLLVGHSIVVVETC